MPRSLQDIIEHADVLASRCEDMEPAGDGHKTAVADLRAAVLDGAAAERQIAEAVRAARADGLSWTAIGLILGTSGEAARKRYSRHAAAGRAR